MNKKIDNNLNYCINKIDYNKMANRDATYSINGYTYQRMYLIYFLMKNINTQFSIKEEGEEDIDIFMENNKRYLQIKYHETNKEKESLTFSISKIKIWIIIKKN